MGTFFTRSSFRVESERTSQTQSGARSKYGSSFVVTGMR